MTCKTCGEQEQIITDPFGIRYYGVPWWVRVAAWVVYLWRGGDDDLPTFYGRWKNCGCIVALKDWTTLHFGQYPPA